ncbi:MAG TPA: prepilin-type N-terminal cleavage/methylation domain-containing protein [Vicinamibacterales bacterium]|nr:prepilin-type N-terminal cleavage/methylation domain-containing protein [Vicinamibacterales bacterium]
MGELMQSRRTRVSASRERRWQSSEGFTLIELLIATVVTTVGGLGAYGIIIMAINANSRSGHESSMAMLTNAVVEQINSTLVGSGTANLSDCLGTNFTIATAPGGAALQDGPGSDIDFSAVPPDNYHMDYAVTSPCQPTGTSAGTYDVRWHVDLIGTDEGTPTNSFLVTVGAKKAGPSLPIHVRVVVGRPE